MFVKCPKSGCPWTGELRYVEVFPHTPHEYYAKGSEDLQFSNPEYLIMDQSKSFLDFLSSTSLLQKFSKWLIDKEPFYFSFKKTEKKKEMPGSLAGSFLCSIPCGGIEVETLDWRSSSLAGGGVTKKALDIS